MFLQSPGTSTPFKMQSSGKRGVVAAGNGSVCVGVRDSAVRQSAGHVSGVSPCSFSHAAFPHDAADGTGNGTEDEGGDKDGGGALTGTPAVGAGTGTGAVVGSGDCGAVGGGAFVLPVGGAVGGGRAAPGGGGNGAFVLPVGGAVGGGKFASGGGGGGGKGAFVEPFTFTVGEGAGSGPEIRSVCAETR